VRADNRWERRTHAGVRTGLGDALEGRFADLGRTRGCGRGSVYQFRVDVGIRGCVRWRFSVLRGWLLLCFGFICPIGICRTKLAQSKRFNARTRRSCPACARVGRLESRMADMSTEASPWSSRGCGSFPSIAWPDRPRARVPRTAAAQGAPSRPGADDESRIARTRRRSHLSSQLIHGILALLPERLGPVEEERGVAADRFLSASAVRRGWTR
jgi:hypothetical protein